MHHCSQETPAASSSNNSNSSILIIISSSGETAAAAGHVQQRRRLKQMNSCLSSYWMQHIPGSSNNGLVQAAMPCALEHSLGICRE
jgi:hypothetical protein